ncbi:hypothetical protein QL285_084185 [Trifolium repens]|nr:hypothetical protein QL285_084185 [Trifolium repens]
MHNNWVDMHFILGMNGSWHNFYQNTVSDEQIQQQQSWQPPEVGWLKRNINAGFHHQGQVANCNWCIRNDAGLFVFAGTAWDKGTHTHSIIDAEALALIEAM